MQIGIQFHNLTKQYGPSTIFGPLTGRFATPGPIGIVGKNGSGKTTFLKICTGYLAPSSGSISWQIGDEITEDRDRIRKLTSISAPYLEPVLELKARENMDLHFSLRKEIQPGFLNQVLPVSGIAHAMDRPLGAFSSGMLQRFRLLLAFGSMSYFLFLDEPTANLDAEGIRFFQYLLQNHSYNRLILIASNLQPEELNPCPTWFEPLSGTFTGPEPKITNL